MKNIQALFRIIRQLNYILTDRQKRNSFIVFMTMIVGSMLELLGVSVIYPFLQLMMDEEAFRSKWYLNWIYDLFPRISFSETIILFCVIIIIIYLIKNLMTLLCSYVQNKYSAQFQRELSTAILESILKRPYEYFINNNSEVILQHVHGDPYSAYGVLMNLYSFVSNFATVVMIGAFLLYTDWTVAIAALVLALTCFMIIVLAFKRKLKEYGKRMITLSAEQSQASHEAIYGIKEISVMNRRRLFIGRYSEASIKVEKITVMNGFLNSCPSRIIEGICIGGFIGIASLRIALGGNPGEFIPMLGAFAMGAFKILPSIASMSGQINGIVFNQARLGNCYENLRESERYDADYKEHVLERDEIVDNENEMRFTNRISIRDISWTYQGAEVPVLEGLNMEIKKGDAVALIGVSGAGKTTLADILLGLLHPQRGSVEMDNLDISVIPNTWSRMVGYVPQSVYLTDATIRDNIAFGLEASEISEDMIWSALEQAQMADYVRSLPKGIYTRVGERGAKFSGGQRQRIAIARALYNNPEILILDEATSALDTETESAVMDSIEALLGKKTLIIIAHRLTTIRNCNKVYEIKNGIAVERDKDEVISAELIV